ncbi:putative lipid II flippase FtsW [Nitriliruptor alkaliphilus]|uniref:putative lipid II flippase FtsW n=1 Tax=Nitriliruptor alkaliphilus TaxID=427918 RepID=UPI0006989B9E|nr:putative lipid II flippase FtsW [Nitriliruptor alkaliphilus]
MSAPTDITDGSPSGAPVRPGGLARLRQRWQPGPWSREATALTVVIAVLTIVGLVMSFSASFVDAAQDGDPFGVFRRQLVWVALGVPAFVLTAGLDHRIWRRLAWPMLLGSVVGLLLVLTPVGVERFGSTRWLGFGPLVVQPTEIAKLALLLWLADVLERKRPKDGALQATDHLLIPALPAFGVLAVLVLLQPDLGTTVLLGLIVGAVLWVEGLTGRIVGSLLALSAFAVAILAVVEPYRFARIAGWLHPEDDPLGSGFQLLQSWYAMADGGLFGHGLGSGRGKYNFIPNPETDFIFAIVGEELGLVGAVILVGLFVAVLHLGLKIAYLAEDPFGRTIAAAITAWIVGQAFINIATVIGLLPITGVTLPLVSVGGSSLVSTLVALGILVAVARRPEAPPVRQRATGPRPLAPPSGGRS